MLRRDEELEDEEDQRQESIEYQLSVTRKNNERLAARDFECTDSCDNYSDYYGSDRSEYDLDDPSGYSEYDHSNEYRESEYDLDDPSGDSECDHCNEYRESEYSESESSRSIVGAEPAGPAEEHFLS